MPHVSVHRAELGDRPVLARLWLMFRHDMSEFRNTLSNSDGTFRADRLESAFNHADWEPHLLSRDERPVGFTFVRGVTSATRVLNSFFIVRGARRRGIGLRAMREVLARYPGPWQVAFQDDNTTAARFWRHVATEVAGSAWTERRRPVPNQPDLPHDVWISFDTHAQSAH